MGIFRTPTCSLLLMLLTPWMGSAQTAPDTVKPTPDFQIEVVGATTDFNMRIQRYSELRDRLAKKLPAMTVTDDVGQIRTNTRALAAAIRDARPGAVRGEFFTAAASAAFTVTLALVMNPTVWAVIMDDNPGTFTHKIDGAYPADKTLSTMPGIILARLPPLPEDLQFRFLGTDLILYDVRANIIVDRLPHAIDLAENAH